MNEPTKNRIPFIVSMTIIAVAAIFLVIGGILAFIPVNVVKANTQPYKVITKTIEAGDNLVYIADVCKFENNIGIASRVFVDENNVHYPIATQSTNIPAGCAHNQITIPTLPDYKTGTWYLIIDVEYQVNPLRRQTYHFKTETFTIVNKTIEQGVK